MLWILALGLSRKGGVVWECSESIIAALARKRKIWQKSIFSDDFENKINTTYIQIGKRQLHFIWLNYVLFDLNKPSKYTYTAFMFTFCYILFSVKLTASNVEYCFSICYFNVTNHKMIFRETSYLESPNLDHLHSIEKKH